MASYFLSLTSIVSDIWYIPAIMCGVGIGILFGALPGISAPIALSIAVPFTYSLEPKIGFGVLIGLFNGVAFGGSIPAVLINVPGTPSTAITTLDGYPMTRRGEAGKALAIVCIASFIGGIFSTVALIFISPLLAHVALKFAPHDYFAIGVFGLSIVSSISGKSVLLGFWAAMLGILISTIGMDYVTSEHRFVYGIHDFLNGIPCAVILVGIFGFSHVLLYSQNTPERGVPALQSIDRIHITWNEFKSIFRGIVQGSIIGTIIGALPGPGGAIASFASYDAIKKTSRNDHSVDTHDFGKGRLEGVAAPEAANNAVTGGCLIPALTLGMPGDAAAAIILSAFMMYNIVPGPLFIQNHIDVLYGIYNSLIISNIFMVAIGLCCLRLFLKALTISNTMLTLIIVAMCVTGAFTVQNSIYGILIMVVCGVIGLLFKCVGIPVMPLVLGVILGPMIEINLRQALIIEGGDFSRIILRPSSGIILLVSIISMVAPYIRIMAKKKWHSHWGENEENI